MSIDTAPFVGDLDVDLPFNRDMVAEGAGQIRAIKIALLKTFPNIKGEVTLTDKDFNKVTQHGYVVGMIMDFWTNDVEASPPPGFGWCDGNLYNKMVTPDLRNLFIKAWDGDLKSVGTKGGNDGLTSEQVVKLIEVDGASLTVEQLPEVKSDFWAARDNGENRGGEHYLTGYNEGGREGRNFPKTVIHGKGEKHKHPIIATKEKIENIEPKFYVLSKIMFVGFPAE